MNAVLFAFLGLLVFGVAGMFFYGLYVLMNPTRTASDRLRDLQGGTSAIEAEVVDIISVDTGNDTGAVGGVASKLGQFAAPNSEEEKSRQRQMLMQVDKYEMVRTAVIDLFMALGKTERYAKNLGNLAKAFARELNVEIFDDRDTPPAFIPRLNPELVNEVKNLRKGRYLQLWESQKMAS